MVLCDYLGKVLELCETRVKTHRVVATFPKSPSRLNFAHSPHLVDAFRQLVADVLHKTVEK